MRMFFNKEIDSQIINCQTFLLRFIIWNNHRLVSVERVSKNSLSHPFTMQESTFFVLEELNFCISQHLEELLILNLKRAKDIIVETIGEIVWYTPRSLI